MKKNLDCSDCMVRENSCFNVLNEQELYDLSDTKFSFVYRKGQMIFHEGHFPTGIYCLNKGKVKIFKVGYDGKEQIVRFVLPGGLLGIRALMSGRSYMASATTLEESVVCHIPRQTFFDISKNYPSISHCVMTTLSKLLEEAEERMTSLAQKPVRERLAESLLVLDKLFKSESCQVKDAAINLSREDLANIVGTATETVIRLLSDFREENLISILGRQIRIINMEEIKKIARYQA
jgi:CRP-like cAMP-binding protein